MCQCSASGGRKSPGPHQAADAPQSPMSSSSCPLCPLWLKPIVKRKTLRFAGFALGALVFALSAWYIAATFEWASIGRLLSQVDLVVLVGGGGGSLLLY